MEYRIAEADGFRIRYAVNPENGYSAIVPTEDIDLGGGNYISSFPAVFSFGEGGERYVRIYRFSHPGRPDGEGRPTSVFVDATPEYLTVEDYEKMVNERRLAGMN